MRIVIGQGSCGIAAGAEKIRKALTQQNVKAEISITGCIGMCWLEPIVDIYDGDRLVRLVRVAESDAQAIAAYVETGDESKIDCATAVSSIPSSSGSILTRAAIPRSKRCSA